MSNLKLFCILFFIFHAFPNPVYALSPNSRVPNLEQLTADEFEYLLERYLNVHENEEFGFKVIDKGSVSHRGKTYKYTQTRRPFDTPYYFRAGDVFVINSEFIPSKESPDYQAFHSLMAGYDKVIFLAEVKSGLGAKDKGWTWYQYYSFEEGRYYLPLVIAMIIGMQAIEDQIKDHPFIDIGSRNGLLGNIALKLGASEAILIENDVFHFDEEGLVKFAHFGSWRVADQFGVTDTDDLIDVNLKINSTVNHSQVYKCSFSEVPELHLPEGSVASFNFPKFGEDYFQDDLPPDLPRGGSLFSIDLFTRMTSHLRKGSLIRDVLTKIKGLAYVLAGGGDSSEYDVKPFEEKITRLPLSIDEKVDILAHEAESKAGWRDQKTGKWRSETKMEQTFARTYILKSCKKSDAGKLFPSPVHTGT
ncbi:MAG: hypothetical protein JW774_02950 [Candidatus Aureabacteria bacterium]|nr:hypothetical protein [Candidatus Auribacterota bacterium]